MTRRLPGRSLHFINSPASLPAIAKVIRHREFSEFALLVRKKPGHFFYICSILPRITRGSHDSLLHHKDKEVEEVVP